jgi:hypothetical protein
VKTKKLDTWSEANDEASRIILSNPDKYPGIMQVWARLYRKLTTVEQEYAAGV